MERSLIPSATHNTESSVLPAKISIVWDNLCKLEFHLMAPSIFESVERISGEESQVGSTYTQVFKDGALWDLRLTEVSERHHTIAYEVLTTSPSHPTTSITGEIQLLAVTDTDETFIKWETNFSSDVDVQVISDQRFKKLDFFESAKKVYS